MPAARSTQIRLVGQLQAATRALSRSGRIRMSVGVGLIGLAYLALMLILPKGVPVAALIPGLVNMGGVVATLVVLLVTVAHWNYLLALLGGVIAALFLGAGVERGLLGPLSKAPRLIATVATIGVAQLLAAATIFLPRLMHARARLGGAVPFHSPWAVQAHIGSLLLTSDHFQAMLAIPAVLIGLVWYFNKTDSGIGARGAADSVERAQLLGIPVRRLSLTTWMVASLLSSLGAVLLAGVQGFQVSTLGGPETLVMPMAAAVIAGLDSLTVAFVASLGIGVLQQAIFWSYPQSSVVSSLCRGHSPVLWPHYPRSAPGSWPESWPCFCCQRSRPYGSTTRS